jgi:hypothetical protein
LYSLGIQTSPTVETQYVSFITATPTVNGAAAAAAVVAGVVIAPALIGSIQTVADAAAGKTVQMIAQELADIFKLRKVTLTPGDLQSLSNYVLNAVTAAAAVKGAKLAVSAYWTPATAPLAASVTLTVTTSTGSSTTSSSTGGAGGGGSTAQVSATTSNSEPTITAIMKRPYEGWPSILAAPITGDQIPISDTDAQPPQCEESKIGIDPGIAKSLATQFCTGSSVDFTKDATKTLGGSDLQPNVDLDGVSIQFDYKHASGTCTQDCASSYAQMITSCKSLSTSPNAAHTPNFA